MRQCRSRKGTTRKQRTSGATSTNSTAWRGLRTAARACRLCHPRLPLERGHEGRETPSHAHALAG
eukprot:10561451-Heterocapsa_arctica.AAC.1